MARRRTGKFHGGRALLNLPGHHSTAAIVAEIGNTSKWRIGTSKDEWGDPLTKWSTPSCTLQIANCDRSIAFEMDGLSHTSTDEHRANDLYKIDTMIDILQKFRAGLVIEHQRAQDRYLLFEDDDD